MIDLARSNPSFRPVIERALIGEPDAILLVEFTGDDAAGDTAQARRPRGCAGQPRARAASGQGPARRRAEVVVGRAEGGPQYHDEPARRRQAGVVHRGLRRPARAPRRIRRPPHRNIPPPRHARHVVRACIGGNAACAADPRHAPRRRAENARDRRGGVGDRPRIQGCVLGRARRRTRAQRMGRVAVRTATHTRVRSDQGSVRSRGADEPGQDRSPYADGRREPVPLSARASDARGDDGPRLVGLGRAERSARPAR